jgi:hypothetical protein
MPNEQKRLQFVFGLAVSLALLATGCRSVPVPIAPDSPVSPTAAVASFDEFLGRYVDGQGRVDYAAAHEDRSDLDRYLAAIAASSPDSDPNTFATDDERLAYWINAYNAWVIAMVLEAWPIDSVLDVDNPLGWIDARAGFFLLQRVTVGGERMSLLSLENDIIRKRFDEPRVHFALNCASKGCPRLPREAFSPVRLSEQLEREAQRFLYEDRNACVDDDARLVRLSSIFDWYEADFTGWMERNRPGAPATLVGYLRDQAGDRVSSCDDCEVEFFEYDWALNVAPSAHASSAETASPSVAGGSTCPSS